MNTKRVEEQVNLLVSAYTCKYIRETQQGTWKCDQWEFTINGEKFDFFTGLGHRGLTEKAARVPATPHVITMLHSLFVDSQAATQSFKDWCEEYGYSPNSRKVLEMYLECQEIDSKLRATFCQNTLAKLKALFEDY